MQCAQTAFHALLLLLAADFEQMHPPCGGGEPYIRQPCALCGWCAVLDHKQRPCHFCLQIQRTWQRQQHACCACQRSPHRPGRCSDVAPSFSIIWLGGQAQAVQHSQFPNATVRRANDWGVQPECSRAPFLDNNTAGGYGSASGIASGPAALLVTPPTLLQTSDQQLNVTVTLLDALNTTISIPAAGTSIPLFSVVAV